jgi:hypothetical protein
VTGFVFRQVNLFEECVELVNRRKVAMLDSPEFSSDPMRANPKVHPQCFGFDLYFFKQLPKTFFADWDPVGCAGEATFGAYLSLPLFEPLHRNPTHPAYNTSHHGGVSGRCLA